MADAALDYEFLQDGDVLRLTGTLARGWKEGPYGPFFIGVCEFDWRYGLHCRAEVRVYPASRASTLESVSLIDGLEYALTGDHPHDRNHIDWEVDDGSIVVTIPLMTNGRFTDLVEDTGFNRGRITHTAYGTSGGDRFRLQLLLQVKMDDRSRGPTVWHRGGLPSAGLPTLGKRR